MERVGGALPPVCTVARESGSRSGHGAELAAFSHIPAHQPSSIRSELEKDINTDVQLLITCANFNAN